MKTLLILTYMIGLSGCANDRKHICSIYWFWLQAPAPALLRGINYPPSPRYHAACEADMILWSERRSVYRTFRILRWLAHCALGEVIGRPVKGKRKPKERICATTLRRAAAQHSI